MRILASIPSLTDVDDPRGGATTVDDRAPDTIESRTRARATIRRSRTPFPGWSIVLLAVVAAATWSLAWWRDLERRAAGPERFAQAPAAAPVAR